MPSRRRPPEPPPMEIRRFTPDEAEWATKLLQSRIADVTTLAEPKPVHRKDPKVDAVENRIRSTILEVFRENSPEYREHQYHHISAGRSISAGGWGEDPRYAEAQWQQNFVEGLPGTITMLQSLIDTVKERTDAGRPVLGTLVRDRAADASDKVFEPVILQEQASEGRTLIEKFERHSEAVAFAVVLLTAEDRGGLADADPGTYLPRARQNVILELGYFVGTLKRRGVCVLHEPGVEIPSDFHGVVYVPLDPGGAWRLLLAKEMKAAGLDIDLNKAI